MPGNDLTLDGLVSRLIAFELSNFDNSVPKFENAFKSPLTIGSSKKEKSRKDESDSDFSENEMDGIKSLLSRRLPRVLV